MAGEGSIQQRFVFHSDRDSSAEPLTQGDGSLSALFPFPLTFLSPSSLIFLSLSLSPLLLPLPMLSLFTK